MTDASKFHLSPEAMAKIAEVGEDLKARREQHRKAIEDMSKLPGGFVEQPLALKGKPLNPIPDRFESLVAATFNLGAAMALHHLHDFGARGEGGTAGPVEIGGAAHLIMADGVLAEFPGLAKLRLSDGPINEELLDDVPTRSPKSDDQS